MDLTYFNSRLRGLRGKLLKKTDYEILIAAKSIDEYLTFLRGSFYGADIEVASIKGKGQAETLDTALKMNLTEFFRAIWDLSPREADFFLKIAVSLQEVSNLKAILRGIDKGVEREEMFAALIPCGEFDKSALRELSFAKEIKVVVRILDTCGSIYAKPVKENLESYFTGKGLFAIELSLDRFVFDFYLSGVKGRGLNEKIAREMLYDRIDFANIMTLLKFSGETLDKEFLSTLFIEGGARIKEKDFFTLMAISSRDEIITSLGSILKDGDLRTIVLRSDTEYIDTMEERFDGFILKKLIRASIVEPSTVALVFSVIYMKVREIKNLRLIGRAAAIGIPETELKGFIIYPWLNSL